MRLLSTGLLDWQGWFLLTLFVAILVQRATYAYCAAEWLRLAPEKARVVVREARRGEARAVERCRELEAELAEANGKLAAVKQAVAEEPQPLRLVERQGAGR